MQPVKRSMIVNVQLSSANAGFVKIQDVPVLRNAWITGLKTWNATSQSFTVDQQPVITAVDQILCAVTLSRGSQQAHQNIPLTDFDPTLNAGVWPEFQAFKWDPQKSGINKNGTLATAPCVVPLGILFGYDEDFEPQELQRMLALVDRQKNIGAAAQMTRGTALVNG